MISVERTEANRLFCYISGGYGECCLVIEGWDGYGLIGRITGWNVTSSLRYSPPHLLSG